jgi:hypothetical protein
MNARSKKKYVYIVVIRVVQAFRHSRQPRSRSPRTTSILLYLIVPNFYQFFRKTGEMDDIFGITYAKIWNLVGQGSLLTHVS